MCIASSFPGGHLFDERHVVRDACFETLSMHNTQFNVRQHPKDTRPTAMLGRVVNFQLFADTPRFIR
jgi:hypothetical protein